MRLLKIIERFKGHEMPKILAREKWIQDNNVHPIVCKYGSFYSDDQCDEPAKLSLEDMSADDWMYIEERWIKK